MFEGVEVVERLCNQSLYLLKLLNEMLNLIHSFAILMNYNLKSLNSLV